jgi:hypothetical protein
MPAPPPKTTPPPRIAIDDSRWPLVVATWPAEQLSDEAFQEMLDHMGTFNLRREPYAVIHDARKATRPTPKQRAAAAARQAQDAPLTRRYIKAMALVVSSPLLAGVVTAITWIAPPPFPQKVFSSVEDAEAWVTERLEGY